MKKSLIALSVPVLCALSSTPAKADTSSSAVLTHPVTTAILALLNQKHANQCATPTANNMRWMCMGAIPPVNQATLLANGCGFELEILCPGEVALLSGSTTYYYLDLPQGAHSTVAPSEAVVLFGSISFQPTN